MEANTAPPTSFADRHPYIMMPLVITCAFMVLLPETISSFAISYSRGQGIKLGGAIFGGTRIGPQSPTACAVTARMLHLMAAGGFAVHVPVGIVASTLAGAVTGTFILVEKAGCGSSESLQKLTCTVVKFTGNRTQRVALHLLGVISARKAADILDNPTVDKKLRIISQFEAWSVES